jgi:hypothetical protein
MASTVGSRRQGRRSALSLLAVLATGCARISVDDASPICLTWADGGPLPADTTVPEGLACEVLAHTNDPEIVPKSPHELAYVCVAPEGDACPAPGAAHAQFQSCVEWKKGSCDFGGSCTTHFAWSACGPDPAAQGACCYYAYMVTSSWVSAREPGAACPSALAAR